MTQFGSNSSFCVHIHLCSYSLLSILNPSSLSKLISVQPHIFSLFKLIFLRTVFSTRSRYLTCATRLCAIQLPNFPNAINSNGPSSICGLLPTSCRCLIWKPRTSLSPFRPNSPAHELLKSPNQPPINHLMNSALFHRQCAAALIKTD